MQRILNTIGILVFLAVGAVAVGIGAGSGPTTYEPPADPMMAAVLVGAIAAIVVLTAVAGAGLAVTFILLHKELTRGDTGDERPWIEGQVWVLAEKIAQSPLVRVPREAVGRIFSGGAEEPVAPYVPSYSYQAVPDNVEFRQWTLGSLIGLALLALIAWGNYDYLARQFADWARGGLFVYATAAPATATPVAVSAAPGAAPPISLDELRQEFEALPRGDAKAGEEIFNAQACRVCHLDQPLGPPVAGLAARAASRKPGYSAELYLYESIAYPSAYVVEPFQDGVMPPNFKEILTGQQLADLVAYLASLK